jgi:hypothetical protein
MSDPASIGLLGIYVDYSSAPQAQSIQPTSFTNVTWAELVLLYLAALQVPPLSPSEVLTTNNINNMLTWMEASNPPASWWGTGNNPLSLGTLQQILATIRDMETPPVGNYTSQNYGVSGASGAYQFEQATWQSLTQKYGIGTQYAYAAAAPPAIQDLIAASQISQLLQQYGNNVSVIPLIWYTGNAQGTISAADLAANNGLQPSTYQANWMAKYNSLSPGYPATGAQYKDLASAAYNTAQLLLSSPEYSPIVTALANNASPSDFSTAVVQSNWDPGHFGVPVNGPSQYAVPGRDVTYLSTLPQPTETTAPSSHGTNPSSASGIGWNWANPQAWQLKPAISFPNQPSMSPVPNFVSIDPSNLNTTYDSATGFGHVPASSGGNTGVHGTGSGPGTSTECSSECSPSECSTECGSECSTECGSECSP